LLTALDDVFPVDFGHVVVTRTAVDLVKVTIARIDRVRTRVAGDRVLVLAPDDGVVPASAGELVFLGTAVDLVAGNPRRAFKL